MNDLHRGYNLELEEDKKKREDVMMAVPDAKQDIIDRWSAETRVDIRSDEDFEAWIRGLTKLYGVKNGTL